MNTQWAARLFAGLMSMVAIFQIAIVLGAPWGQFTQGGQVDGTLPLTGRAFAAVSVAVLVLMALGVMARVGEGPLRHAPRRLVTVLAWVAAGYCTLGVFANLASSSTVERILWTPVTAICAALSWWVIARTRRGA